MRRARAFLRRVAGLFGQGRRDRELDDELRSHLALQAEDLERTGMDPAAARREAALRLGSVEAVKEAYRERRGLPLVETTLQDLRYAARSLRHDALASTLTVATLGIGIGATTAMFGVAQAVLLRPLPYPEPGRLVRITETNPLKGWTGVSAAPANFADWRRDNTSFADIAGHSRGNVFLTGRGEPQPLQALYSTGNLFDVLEVSAEIGRTFVNEETFEGKDGVAVLSHGLWQARFGGDPQIVGQTIVLDAKPYTVVGVMPPSFFHPDREVQVWIPLGFKPAAFTEQRRPHYLRTIARLRPGVSIERATEEMQGIAARLEREYPDTNTKMGVRLDFFHSTLSDEKRPALLMLLAAVGVLFLVVCSNVANLLLGRAASRTHEFAIRQALGAARGRLVRQVLTEGLVLSALGGALGLSIAAWLWAALLRWAPSAIPSFAELRLDPWVLLFALGLTFLAPFVFGLGPALTASRCDFLRDRGQIGHGAERSARPVLVAAEAALSIVLVVGAVLLAQSLLRLEAVNPGFTPAEAVSFSVSLPEARYPEEPKQVQARAMEEILRRLREQPGVEIVGATRCLPLQGYAYTSDATPEGRTGDDYERELRYNAAAGDYFRAVGAALLRGRFFDDGDDEGSTPVTIVNQALERQYFRGESALGRRIKFGRPQDDDPWVTVVGVVADLRQDGLDQPVKPEAYSPIAQEPSSGLRFVLRGATTAEVLAAGARQAVRSFDPDLAVTDLAPLDDLVSTSTGDARFRTILLAGFAGVALGLAALGVYGVLAYSVARRTREIGVRMALGASRRQLFGMVVRDGMRPVLAGLAVGLPASAAAASVMRSLLFGIAPTDPAAYVSTIAGLAAVAFVACVLPARRALRVEAMTCLRDQ